jgi:hypothetical protein
MEATTEIYSTIFDYLQLLYVSFYLSCCTNAIHGYMKASHSCLLVSDLYFFFNEHYSLNYSLQGFDTA